MTSAELLLDEDARRAVVDNLDDTLFLEAGAGSGKTSCLVERFIALVKNGIEADRIAAITFTEKAAGELIDRIRTRLQTDAQESPACREALLVLDNAAIGTLHSFAQRILNEHPIEAGLPPKFTVNDEIASQVAFDERWGQFADSMLEDPGLDAPLRLLFASGGRPKHLRDVAVAFNANWDLVVDRAETPRPPAPSVDVRAILQELSEVIAFSEHCINQDDRLFEFLTGVLTDFKKRLDEVPDDDGRLRLLGEASFKVGHKGQARNWPSLDTKDIRGRIRELEAACGTERSRVLEDVLQTLGTSLAQFTAASATARRVAGEVEFHDLLVLARNMLRKDGVGPTVRRSLAQRYQRLLLDEFQDTDPIQIEIAVLIASDESDAGRRHWSNVTVEPGRLFFVGDPKQSIYRFRRADIGMFMTARDGLVGTPSPLTRNFRTGRPIVEWINATFSKIIVQKDNSQPAYQALISEREAPENGPPVAFFGCEHDDAPSADGLRSREVTDVSATVRRVIREGWSVAERGPLGADHWRPARWRDIAVLLPARTSLPFLERALEAAGIPFRAETSSLVYGTREIRDLMLVARAVDDPTDSLSVVSALRTPAFGCGDDDLYVWRKTYRGDWDHQSEIPEGTPRDHPVAQGISWMRDLHRRRHWLSPSQALDHILRDRRFFELAAAQQRPRDLWRRLRFVLDQCRAWEEAGGNSLREYLQWVEGQSTEGTRVVETVLPETDDDAVRILTIHGAKGLEFPVVILSGLTTAMNSQPRGVEVRFPQSEGWAIRLSNRMSTSDFEETQSNEAQMDYHERLRLLYVATTRARDHLAVSVHRKARSGGSSSTAAEVLSDEGWDPERVDLLELSDEPPFTAKSPEEAAETADLPSLDNWRSARDAAFAVASQSVATSATRLAAEAAALASARHEPDEFAPRDAGLAKGARDIDLPPWQKGRYGTAIGRAVHGVLQTVDLPDGSGLAAASAAQAAAEGVLGTELVIEALAQAAIDSDTVQTAALRAHWREVYVGIPYGNGVLEGYIDLLYEDDDGLVIVDYKTDAVRGPAELEEKVERYSVQLRAYAQALRVAVGRPVQRAVLLFLSPRSSEARAVHLA